jgi:hypothetical protein
MLRVIDIGYDEPAAKDARRRIVCSLTWYFAKSRFLASLGMTTKCYFSASCRVGAELQEFSRRKAPEALRQLPGAFLAL